MPNFLPTALFGRGETVSKEEDGGGGFGMEDIRSVSPFLYPTMRILRVCGLRACVIQPFLESAPGNQWT